MTKHSLYLSDDVLEEVRREAKRQGRTMSQILRYAWRIAQPEIKKMQGAVHPKESHQ